MKGSLLAIVAAPVLLLGGTPSSSAVLPEKAKTVTPVATTRTEMLYSVSAHADDELAAWTFIDDRPSTYEVIVIMTQGEGTNSCDALAHATPPPTGTDVGPLHVDGVTRSDVSWAPAILGPEWQWSGPHKYQGVGSPGPGQPDKGERHPFGNPWQGQGTQACKDARVASWHWFHDDAAAMDSGLPSFDVVDDPEADDDYVGEFCEPPHLGNGAPGSDLILCAKVWRNADGARVAFNSPDVRDNPLNFEYTRNHTIRAIELLRANRAPWGLPLLPEVGILANAYHYEGDVCLVYAHPQHKAVQEAILNHDFGAGPQYGSVACPADPRLEGSSLEVHPWDDTLDDIQWVDPITQQRVGPYNVNYGWLFEEFTLTEGNPFVWRRFD